MSHRFSRPGTETFRSSLSRTLRIGWASLALGAAACSASVGDPPPSGGSCEEGKLACGECVDVTQNLLHCGGCYQSCEAGEDCVSGQCLCVPGLTACGAGCVNLLEDRQHCGSCGNACDAGLVCSNGICSSSCGAGLELCDGSCTDTRTSALNCGGCGRTCAAGQACQGGACVCTQGRADCGSGCVDLSQDALHCGTCNNACPSGEACSGGTCQASGAGGSGAAPGIGGTGGVVNTGGTGNGAATGGAGNTGGVPAGGSGGQVSTGGVGNTGGVSSGGTGGSVSTGGMGNAGAGNSGGSGNSGGGTGGSGGNPGCAASGFHVAEGAIFDSNCNEFIIRGVNYPYAWYSSRNTQQDFSAIAAAGANAVRIVLATGARWDRTSGGTLTNIINAAKSARLISIVEVHDTTGWSEQSGSVDLGNATNYWTGADIRAALSGQEAYVILNIGNEPMGNDTTNEWAPRHAAAVQALRNAGYGHLLMIDAPNWGQDWSNTMRDGGGASIWNADPDKNLVFSVHMYDVYGTSQMVSSYFNGFLSNYDAPLVVGEFASDHGSSGNVDEDAIMSFAESLGVGYIGWSWSGNSTDLASLDITNGFNPSSLTTWGNRLINGSNGLLATSEVCSCFD